MQCASDSPYSINRPAARWPTVAAPSAPKQEMPHGDPSALHRRPVARAGRTPPAAGDRSGQRGGAGAGVGGRPGRCRGGHPRGAAGLRPGHLALAGRLRAGGHPATHRRRHRGRWRTAGAAGNPQRRQDPGRKPGGRRQCGRHVPLLRGTAGGGGRHGQHPCPRACHQLQPARAGGRLRVDRALELPAAAAGLEGRPGPGRRQLPGGQAQQPDAADRPAPG
ncbi:hypothetical protein D3C80_931230 [compost metagenome]